VTTLEAVKWIAEHLGLQASPALDTGGPSDMAIIERKLDEAEYEVQVESQWHYATLTKLVIEADIDGRFALPVGTLEIDTDYTDKSRNVCQRGAYLYDLDNNTDVFTEESLHVTVRQRITFGCIPVPVQMLIASRAMLSLATSVPRFFPYAGVARDEVRRWKSSARAHDTRTSDVNVLRQQGVQDVLGNRRTFRDFGLG
jgi:hypothetical protein